jgi:hypothetical protein
MSYASMVIREAESAADAARDSRDFRDRCETALLEMSPAEMAERVATVLSKETLFYMLTGQTSGRDYLDAMDDDQLARFCGVDA